MALSQEQFKYIVHYFKLTVSISHCGFQPMASNNPIYIRTNNHKQNNIGATAALWERLMPFMEWPFTYAVKIFTITKITNNITHGASLYANASYKPQLHLHTVLKLKRRRKSYYTLCKLTISVIHIETIHISI